MSPSSSPLPTILLWASILASIAQAQPGAPVNGKVSFAREVAPIISSKCYHCHGQDAHSRKAGLRLDLRDEALKEHDGTRAIVPGKPTESALLERVLSSDKDEVMPPPKEGHAVTPAEADILRKWIAQGAEYEGHWAFRAPRLSEIPPLKPQETARNPIDHFIANNLGSLGLTQSPEADPQTLLRRISLDLIGLPPTPLEMAVFQNDPSPDRYEKAVDRLLASPHFGEKWARPWLDLARYADSTGYGSDMLRLNIWPYRDWVINALNANQPFDQFSTDQIAGDLLPDPTRDQIVATAFHRNTMTQNEGGTDDEEYRVAAVKDRVATTMQGWMGLTAGCAQCHSHKFDPLTQKEYYQLFAIFNQTEDSDKADEAPRLALPSPAQNHKIAQLQFDISALEADSRKPNPEIDREQELWETQMRSEISWKPATIISATSRKGAISPEQDGTLKVGENRAKQEQYTVTIDVPEGQVRAIRLEIFPEENTKGNFRLSEVSIDSQPVAKSDSKTNQQPGKPERLEIAYASASQAAPGNGPERAIDNDPKTGWAFAAQTPQAAAFELKMPTGGHPLKLTLKQDDAASPVFTQFRISFTDHAGPVRELPKSIREILALEPISRDAKQKKSLAEFFRPQSNIYQQIAAKITDKKKELAANKPVEIPIMKETAGMRKSFILNKGNYLTPGEEVQAALPASFHNTTQGSANRLTLAHWIFSPENPLTSRVAVNRFWSQIFGTGLVETEEDFGTQGSWPTHPELLDWLAIQFQNPREKGGLEWDTKALLKLLVTSHTYRQTSRVSSVAQQKDPRNVLLSHYTRRRLEAEAIRDQALAVSGLLSQRLGGPSVYPPQPDGLWKIAFRGVEKYPTSTGEDRWRRSLYTIWRRIAPNPTMATFDAPSREACTLRRVPTNTPLQAFVTLNDPVYFETAQALARRILREAPKSVEERLRYGLSLVLQRTPSEKQLGALQQLLESELTQYQANLEAAKKLSASSELPLPKDADPAELAAWTAVSNVLLNLDGFLTKS
ncbi:MAG: PSD1 and planctomycete cytochrome C domain-containing protein [Verrucomicrobiota bacterium]